MPPSFIGEANKGSPPTALMLSCDSGGLNMPQMKLWCQYGGETRSICHILKGRKECTWKIALVFCIWYSLPITPSVLVTQANLLRNLPRNIQNSLSLQ